MFNNRLQGMTPPVYVPSCKVRTVLESLSKEDRTILEEALANPAWKGLTLSENLLARGISLDGKLITRHRKKLCSCEKA